MGILTFLRRLPRSPVFWALLIAVPLLTALRPVVVAGPSMLPAFHSGDRLLVERVSPRLGLLSRGAAIVFRDPRDPAHPIVIKRIIGLPGETVRITPTSVTIVRADGSEETVESEGWNGDDYETRLGPEDYYLLGDNREESTDSRHWGTIQPHEMIGRPVLRLAPFSRFALWP